MVWRRVWQERVVGSSKQWRACERGCADVSSWDLFVLHPSTSASTIKDNIHIRCVNLPRRLTIRSSADNHLSIEETQTIAGHHKPELASPHATQDVSLSPSRRSTAYSPVDPGSTHGRVTSSTTAEKSAHGVPPQRRFAHAATAEKSVYEA